MAGKLITALTAASGGELVAGSVLAGSAAAGTEARKFSITQVATIAHANASFTGTHTPPDDDGAAQAVVSLRAGTGAPSDANGADGDFYFRADGTVAGNTVAYHKQGGVWVAFTTT